MVDYRGTYIYRIGNGHMPTHSIALGRSETILRIHVVFFVPSDLFPYQRIVGKYSGECREIYPFPIPYT